MVRGIPINYAKTQEVLPVKEETERVLVLTTNPINHKALEDLRVKFDKRSSAGHHFEPHPRRHQPRVRKKHGGA